jgi:hypothetical protein
MLCLLALQREIKRVIRSLIAGTHTFLSGNKYVGESKNDKMNGQGTFTVANGTVKEGIWKNNEFPYARKMPKQEPKVITKRTTSRPGNPTKI